MDSKYDYQPFKALTWVVTIGTILRWAVGIRTAAMLPEMISSINARQGLNTTDMALTSVSLLTWVLFLVWVHRAACNAHALAAGVLEFTPGWSVGWWLVPLANFVMPYQVMAGLWRSSDLRYAGSTWRETPVPHLLWVFWISWLIATFLNGALVLAPGWAVEAMISGTVTSALLLWFVWTIEERQARRHTRLPMLREIATTE